MACRSHFRVGEKSYAINTHGFPVPCKARSRLETDSRHPAFPNDVGLNPTQIPNAFPHTAEVLSS